MKKAKRTHAFVVSLTLDEALPEPQVRKQLRELISEASAAYWESGVVSL